MSDMNSLYRTIAAGAGWADKSARGRLRLAGADRARFLHALLTNEVAALPPGAGTYALYLTPQGRVIADLHLFVRAGDVVADVPAALASSLAATFDGLVFSEDVRVSDESAALAQIAVVGAQAPDVIARACAVDAAALRALALWSHLELPGGFVARTDDAGEDSWDLVLDAAAMERTRAALAAAGVPCVPDALMESLRIDAGRPRFGVDFEPGSFPLEAGLLDRAISQNKGCYVGQEVIVRVLHRGGGRVARRLVRVVCESGEPVPPVGAVVRAGEDGDATVTSAAWSPRLNCAVALGYVSRRD